jgi:diadenosine tetraphosphatase ApaH/serine/threonine PP2A family protein phosphatase
MIASLTIKNGQNKGAGLVIALLADVHSNLEALSACLAHANEGGAGRYAFLGDLVGYGADPQGVVDIVARYAAQGAIVVKGNHDAAVEKRAGYMNDTTTEAIDWTRKVLPEDRKAFLARLPLCLRDESMCFVHASAASPERWHYVDSPAAAQKSAEAAQTPYTFSGHVHDQVLYYQGTNGKMSAFRPLQGSPVSVRNHRRWLALVGSVGQPRDRNPAAAYALFDTSREQITFHRVPYDHLAAARKIRQAGLPASIAYRVEMGI